MYAEGEFIDVGTFATEIEDTDFRVRDTTVESRFGIWLRKDEKLALGISARSVSNAEVAETPGRAQIRNSNSC